MNNVRYQRLILESGGNAVTLRFHDRLTVIAGLGAQERDGLVGEIIGGLAGTRQGTHLEILDDTSRRLAVLRNRGREHRVVDLETGTEVTGEFARPDGNVDLLGWLGFTHDSFRRRTRLTAADMAAAGQGDAAVARLARVDQAQLWAAADRVQETEILLHREAEAAGAAPEDVPLIEEIEQRHEVFEAAQQKLDTIRHYGIFVGGACVLGAIPLVLMDHPASFAFLAIAIATTIVSIFYRRRMEKARKAELRALEEAGATSYIGFQLQRVNVLMGHENRRRVLAHAAAENREAVEAWRALAGEIGVDWAFANRAKIEAEWQRLEAMHRKQVLVADTGLAGVEPADLAQAFISRMNDLRHAAAPGESLPIILDEPLAGLGPSVKQWMLELIGRSAGMPQVVYLTNDPDVAAWARMEAVSGEVGIIEPTPEHEDTSITL